MRASLTALTVILAGLGAPGVAAAKMTPPGNSAVSQYVESVPGAGGNVPSLSVHPGHRGGSDALAPTTLQALQRQGSDGARAAALAAATAPPGVRGVTGRHRTRGSGTGAAGPGGTGTGGGTGATPGRPGAVSGSVATPASAVLKAVAGSATHGLGAALPLLLVGGAVGAVALAVARRRRRT